MKIAKILLSTTLLASLYACDYDREIAVYDSDARALHLDVTIGDGVARTNPTGDAEAASQFCDGDLVQLTCEDGYMSYRYAGGKWSPADNCYFRWGDAPMTYGAYYPVVPGASMTNFTLPANQKSKEAIAAADYMVGSVADAVDDGSHVLSMKLHRKMARVVMKLEDVPAKSKVQGVKIGSYQGYVNDEVNTATGLVTPYVSVPEGVKAGQSGSVYTAIVVPGEANASATFVTFNYLGDDVTLPGIPALKAGQSYEFTLKVEGMTVTLSDPIITPWKGATLEGGDAKELVLDAYYVKPSPSGNGTGLNWDNAMGVDGLRSLLQTNATKEISDANAAKLDGKPIYLAGGDYEMAKDNSGVKIEYSNYSKLVAVNIYGGYSPASTGTDLTKRDVANYVTRLVRNASSTADGSAKGMICLGNQVDLTLDGCVLDGQYAQGEKGNVCGVFVAAGASGNALLHCNNCVIRNFNRENNGNDDGAGIKLNKGFVYLNQVEITGNRGANRGAAIMVAGSLNTVKLFMNRCTIHENYAPGAWGTAIHSGQGWVCMNNTTVLGTPGTAANSITVNGDAHFLVANSTIITTSGNPNGAFRAGALSSTLVNSLLLKGEGTRTIYAGNITSGGFNAFQAADATWGATATDTDITDVAMPAGKLTNGVYVWTVGNEIGNFATLQHVVDAAKAFDVTIGQEFIDWVGNDGFAKDARGVARNQSKMQPGAYDAALQ